LGNGENVEERQGKWKTGGLTNQSSMTWPHIFSLNYPLFNFDHFYLEDGGSRFLQNIVKMV
jgi:hypothetical protein